jgi:hypothetical protein
MNLRGKVVETIDEPVLSWFSFALPYWQYYVNDEYDELWRAARERQEQILRIHRELPLLCSRLDAGALTLH